MNVFPAIWLGLKTMANNVAKEKKTFTTEWLKFGFATLMGAVLIWLMGQIITIPFRYEEYLIRNLNNWESADEMSLCINIGNDKLIRSIRKSWQRGALLKIKSHDEKSVKFWKQIGWGIHSYLWNHDNETGQHIRHSYYGYDIRNCYENSFEDSSFLDSIAALYIIRNEEYIVPHGRGYKSVLDGKESVYSCLDSKKLHGWYRYTKMMLKTDSLTDVVHLIADTYIALTDTQHVYTIPIPITTALVGYSWNDLFDISQSSYQLKIVMPENNKKSTLTVNFGGPTELSDIFPVPDKIEMNGFMYTDTEKISNIANHGLWLHANFKQLENLQYVRLFVITTLLGFVIALFISSLWNIGLLCIWKKQHRARNKE